MNNNWISVKDRPLFTTDDKGYWTCTEDGQDHFLAAIELSDGSWWMSHCIVEDETGLCVVTDDGSEKAGWELEDVSYWQPMPAPPRHVRTLAETKEFWASGHNKTWAEVLRDVEYGFGVSKLFNFEEIMDMVAELYKNQ